ncbi:hypothetical protein AJ88_08035 [Mesorhizobium amorphae CCBAU 01583]|nr:hypothetical protein AJ88_08035 [Mesorhizobium amorphae CCBAU 01583]
MVIVAAVALLMTVKDLATLLLFVTLGLGIPLLFASTLLVYMACLLPLVLAIPNRRMVLICLPLSLALAAAWMFVPNWHRCGRQRQPQPNWLLAIFNLLNR